MKMQMHISFSMLEELFVKSIKNILCCELRTAVAVRKTLVLHKQIKNRPTLAYKNSVRKCYEDMFFITNIHFNYSTSSPHT